MFNQFVRGQLIENTQPRVNRPTTLAILIGLGLGSLLVLWWPGHTAVATLATGLIGVAVGLLGVGLIHRRRHGTTLWGVMMGGQLLGAAAVGLLLLASLAH